MTSVIVMTSVMDLSNFAANSSKVRHIVCSMHILAIIHRDCVYSFFWTQCHYILSP